MKKRTVGRRKSLYKELRDGLKFFWSKRKDRPHPANYGRRFGGKP